VASTSKPTKKKTARKPAKKQVAKAKTKPAPRKKHPGKVRAGAKNFPPEVILEQQNHAIRLKRMDPKITWVAMAKEIGVESHKTAQKRHDDAVAAMRPHADFDEYRARHLFDNTFTRGHVLTALQKIADEIDKWVPTRNVTKVVPGLGTVDVDESKIDELTGLVDAMAKMTASLLKINEREAKLLLLDKTPVGGRDLSTFTDEQLARLVVDQMAEALPDGILEDMFSNLETMLEEAS